MNRGGGNKGVEQLDADQQLIEKIVSPGSNNQKFPTPTRAQKFIARAERLFPKSDVSNCSPWDQRLWENFSDQYLHQRGWYLRRLQIIISRYPVQFLQADAGPKFPTNLFEICWAAKPNFHSPTPDFFWQPANPNWPIDHTSKQFVTTKWARTQKCTTYQSKTPQGSIPKKCPWTRPISARSSPTATWKSSTKNSVVFHSSRTGRSQGSSCASTWQKTTTNRAKP